jgi:hypothetical protein
MKKEPTWDQIGKSIGKKIEKEFKNKDWKCWTWKHEEKNGFFGRILFIIGVLIALNIMGLLEAVPGWVQVLIGVGFAFMRF